MRVVFDTNVFVSALTLPGGSAAKALDRSVTGEHELFLSKPLLHELLGVLARKFARDREELARVALFLSELATIVSPNRRLHVLDDDADNRVLECGVAARADVIVTGDKRMLALESHGNLRIVSIRQFLDSAE